MVAYSKVRVVDSVATSDLTKDDLIGDDSQKLARTKIDDAKELLPKLLPNDGEWHEAAPIIKRAAEEYNIPTHDVAPCQGMQWESCTSVTPAFNRKRYVAMANQSVC